MHKRNTLLFLPFFISLSCFVVVAGVRAQELEVRTQVILPDQVEVNGEEPISNISASDLSVSEQQMIKINATLKNVIEENKKLLDEKNAIDSELKGLRGQNEIRSGRLNAVTRQRDELERRLQQAEDGQKAYQAQLDELKTTLQAKEKEFDSKIKAIEEQQAKEQEEQERAMQTVLPRFSDKQAAAESKKKWQELKQKAQETLSNVESSTQNVTAQISTISQENKKLKEDSAKLHYNLANTFFEQGKYKKAVAEYQKVVALLPNDAAAHYNLAFVSGEFLDDYPLALEHYRQYLHINPQAEDAYYVKEKILEAELRVKTHIDSSLDKDVKKGKE